MEESEAIKILENKDYELWNGDCLELMKNIPDKSIDMILCDLPYGTTACKWDSIIDLNKNIQLMFATHSPEMIGKYREKAVKLHPNIVEKSGEENE